MPEITVAQVAIFILFIFIVPALRGCNRDWISPLGVWIGSNSGYSTIVMSEHQIQRCNDETTLGCHIL